MEKLFSYGTLQQHQVQLDTFGRELEGKSAVLTGFMIDEIEITDATVIQSSGKRFHPILTPTNNPEDSVEGTVFLITEKELREADKYEVDDYKRIEAELVCGDKAWIYVATNSNSE